MTDQPIGHCRGPLSVRTVKRVRSVIVLPRKREQATGGQPSQLTAICCTTGCRGPRRSIGGESVVRRRERIARVFERVDTVLVGSEHDDVTITDRRLNDATRRSDARKRKPPCRLVVSNSQDDGFRGQIVVSRPFAFGLGSSVCTETEPVALEVGVVRGTVVLDGRGRIVVARGFARPAGRLEDHPIRIRLPELPAPVDDLLCLDGPREQRYILQRIEHAGFTIDDVQTHHDDLLALRDRLRASLDSERLVDALGDRGKRLRDGATDLEAAVESGRIGYVSVVATRPFR